jgi:hypothetical protein
MEGLTIRDLRTKAHESFDLLWVDKPDIENAWSARRGRNVKRTARHQAYKWLAHQMGCTRDRCHIGHLFAEECAQVCLLCDGMTYERLVEWATSPERLFDSIPGGELVTA